MEIKCRDQLHLLLLLTLTSCHTFNLTFLIISCIHFIWTGNGKLRILYEGFPMAMLVEKAGGQASTGLFRGQIIDMLDLVPTGIHDKCPVVLGCTRDVQRVLSEYA
jgi:hypothetical protein